MLPSLKASELNKFMVLLVFWPTFGVAPKISDHQQSWEYEDDPWKVPGPPRWWPLIFIGNMLPLTRIEGEPKSGAIFVYLSVSATLHRESEVTCDEPGKRALFHGGPSDPGDP